MASTYLTRTFGSTGNRKTFTISVWVKRSSTGENNYIFDCPTSSNHDNSFRISNVDKFGFGLWNGSDVTQVVSNAKLRDCNGFYHLVASVDTTQATASDRVKLYINGELQTNLSSSSYPSQNYDYYINQNIAHYIGYKQPDNARYFKGVMSHFHFIDGTAYDASYFGSTDSTTGEWKINTSPSVTYGTNGFFILKDGNSVTDQSPNTNNFTVGGGTLTKTEDCPSNVFATWNPLQNYWESSSFSDGNTTIYTGSSQYGCNKTTIGASSGKYYWEVKIGASDGAGNIWQAVGINGQDITASNQELGKYNYQIGYYGQDGTIRKNSSNIDTEATYTTNDIIGVAMDLDNNKLYFHKNGTYINSGNPSTGVYGYDITTNPPLGAYFPSVGDWDNNNRFYFYANFGNGFFSTTEITTNTGTGFQDADGKGRFFYNPPTNFRCLSTKGLNQ